MIRKQTSQILVFIFCLVVVAFTVPLWLQPYYVQSMITALSLGLTAMSLTLLAGYGGMVSLTQMSFYAMAAYIVGICTHDFGWPTYIVIPLAIIGSVFLSVIFGIIVIHSEGIYFLMMTLALSQLFYGLAINWESVTHGWNGISGIARPSIFGFSLTQTNPRYYTTLVIIIICYLLLLVIINSPFGLILQGIRDDPKRMSALGFNISLYKFLAIVISSVFAGIAGILGVYSTGVVAPSNVSISSSVLVLMVAMVGGIYHIEGGLVGAIVIVFLVNFIRQYTSRYWIIIGAIFVLVVILLPNGILGVNLKAILSKKRLSLKKIK